MKILHVAESFGGGVVTALGEYVRSSPEHEHWLLRGRRNEVDAAVLSLFEGTVTLREGARFAVPQIRRVVAELAPDVLHAHSSFAGAYVRAAVSARRVPIVYTPHCFGFERKDVSALHRVAYHVIERALALNTTVIAGCSPYEAEIGRAWLTDRRAFYVPNIARVDEVRDQPASPDPALPQVVGVGRLCPQKDPAWFLDVVQHLSAEVAPVWVGGGDADQEAALVAAGVRVTGWTDRATALGVVRESACFVLSSQWEGFPMAVLEASGLGVPVVARELACLPDTPAEVTAHSPEEAAEQVSAILGDPSVADDNVRVWTRYLRENTPSVQRERLLACYERAASRKARARRHPSTAPR
ncbi:glycosyltransferase [Propioniciclava soli]|uniref:glycosyltransferase n=1 Tax=Propioniciclava soli TaxID=2775081 RepID=UPI001E3B7ED4|nr:glycosyltransferase [Propioniciclava soli]